MHQHYWLVIPPSYLDTHILCHLSDVRPYISLLAILFSGPFFESSSFVHFKNGPYYLTRRTGVCPFDEIPVVGFGFEQFSCSPEILFFNFFLSSPLVWWCPFPIFPGTSNFPFIWAFWFISWFDCSISSLAWRIIIIIIIIIIYSLEFSHEHKMMVFHWRLSDSKSPQVSRTLLSILAVFNNAVVWMVSTRTSTSKSSRPFSNPLVTVLKAPITIGIIVTFIFHSFFNSLARSRYLSLFSHSFSFILWSAGTAKSTILQIFFFFCW